MVEIPFGLNKNESRPLNILQVRIVVYIVVLFLAYGLSVVFVDRPSRINNYNPRLEGFGDFCSFVILFSSAESSLCFD